MGAFRSLPAPWHQLLPGPARRALAGTPGWETHREALRRGGQRDGRLWWGGAVAFTNSDSTA